MGVQGAPPGTTRRDPFARPSGTIPNDFHTPYPPFENYGTKQPKVDGRVDYDSSGRQTPRVGLRRIRRHGRDLPHGPGSVPLLDNASGAYAKVDYRGGGCGSRASSTSGTARPPASWRRAAGQPAVPELRRQELGHRRPEDPGASRAGTRSPTAATTGTTGASITMAPGAEEARPRSARYIQDEILLSDHFRWLVGGRVDKYNIPEKPGLLPRTALLVKPTPEQTFRLSYSRAYRAPSLFQNYLDTLVANRIDLGLLNPLLAGTLLHISPCTGLGNLDLEGADAGCLRGQLQREPGRGPGARHRRLLPDQQPERHDPDPDGFVHLAERRLRAGRFRRSCWMPWLPGTPSAPDWACRRCSVSRTSARFATRASRPASTPSPSATSACSPTTRGRRSRIRRTSRISKINLPPTHRFNAGLNFDYQRILGDVSVAYTVQGVLPRCLSVHVRRLHRALHGGQRRRRRPPRRRQRRVRGEGPEPGQRTGAEPPLRRPPEAADRRRTEAEAIAAPCLEPDDMVEVFPETPTTTSGFRANPTTFQQLRRSGLVQE